MTGHNRRRFLTLAGVTGVASLAGCSSIGTSGGDDVPDDGDEPSGETSEPAEVDIPESALTAVVEPDQEALEAYGAELNQQLEAGEISEEEAAGAYQERELELADEAVETLESALEETEGVTAADAIPEGGVVLVDGDAEAMVGALNDGTVNAYLSGETFAMVQQQVEMQAQLEAQMEAEAEAQAEAGEGEPDGEAESDGETETDGDDESE
ncbi:gas vesicle protein GvpG [Natronobiforma cellulositropha]|uniref:gas vesicle protein GvpG n=1 Tax=Natronobiforma cellulositropha TaxID=1679076 RepID=UPI0021D59634|nr:gas vesicle protein GvpG [Natronobiforma cellulositropha]